MASKTSCVGSELAESNELCISCHPIAYASRVFNTIYNGAPNGADFVTLVKNLIEDFRHGTNANLRSSLLMDLRVCHAILSGNDDVYAQRMAEAIFRTLYSRTLSSDPHMAELSIRPADAPKESPDQDASPVGRRPEKTAGRGVWPGPTSRTGPAPSSS